MMTYIRAMYVCMTVCLFAGGGRCGPYALSLFYSMSSRGTSIIRRIERERYVPVAPSPPPLPLPPLTFRSFYHPPSLYSSPSPPPSSVPSTSATPVEEVAAMKVSLTAAPAAMASNASTSTSALHKEVPLGTSNPVNPYPSSLPKRGRVIPSPSLTPVEREAPAVPALSHAYAAQSTPTPTPPPPSPSLIPRLPELVAIKPRETNRLNIRPLEERKAGAAASVVDIRNRNNCWKENNRTKSWDVQGLSPGVGIVNPLKVGVASRCDCYKSATAKDCSHCGNKATVSDPNDRRGTARCQTETVSASTGTGTATAAVQPILSDGGLGGHGHGPGPAKQSNDGSKDGCDSKKEPSSIPHLLPSLLPQSTSIVATPTPALQGTTLQTSQKLKSDSGQLSTTGANSIPVGIAVARQRQQSDSNVNIAPDLRPRNRPLTTRLKDSPADVSNLPAMTVLACEDHSTNSYSPWPPQPLPQWQYPSAVPLEQPLPFHPPVGFQLARDSVSGQFLLIPPSQPNLDSLQRTVVWPNNMTAAQPLLLPAQPSHHVVVDRLVAVAAAPASNESSKRKSQSATIMKIEDSPITGMMMSCEYSKSSQSSVTQQNGLALIQPLQNNQSSLISQPHFSTISSSGSVLIQHISGTSSITPTLQLNPQQLSTNNTTNSLLIASAQQLSTDATSAHSLLNQHSSGSLVINTQEIGSQIIGQFNLNQHHPALINNISALNQPFVSTANLSSTNHQSFVNLSSSNNQSAFVSTTNIISPNFSNHQTSVNMLAPNNDLHSTNQNNFISTDNMMNYCRPPTINIISPDLNLHSPVLPNSSSSFVTSTKICAPTVIPSQENTGKTDNNSDLSGDHQSLLKYAVPEPSNSSAPSFVLKNYHTQGIAQQQLSDQHHQPIRKLIHASVATSISSCDEDDYTDSNKEEENERVETKFNEKSDSDSENSDKNDNDTTSRGDCSNSYNNDRITIISKSDNCSNSNIYHVRMANDVENVCNNNFSGNASCGNVDADLYNDEDEESNDELGKPTGCVKSLEKSQSRSQATSPVTFASSNSESEESEEIEDVETMVAHILARDVCSGVNDPPNLHNSWKIKKELDELSNNHKSSIDLSGLELLSNSIEQFEHKLIKEEENLPEIKVKSESSKACEMISDCSSVMEDEVKPVKECPTPPPSLTESTEVEDPENLSGLGLLCALAHQRYIEEEIAVDSDHNSEHTSDNCTLRHGSSNHHNYHSREAEIEAKKIIASKQYNSYMRPTSPEYDSAEMEMRCRIAELQKIYQQKQRELSKLTPRKYRTSESSTASNPSTTTAPSTPAPPTPAPVVKRGPGRPRKNFDSDLSKSPKKKDSSYDPLSPFSFSSPKKTNKGDFTNVLKRKRSESPVGRKKQRQLSTETGDLSPPVLEPMCPAAPNLSTKLDVLKPPTLTPSRSIDCKLADIKSNKTAHKSPFRMYERKSISQNNSRCSSPFNQDSDSSVDAITPLSPPCLSPMSSSPLVSPPSSSKKRKVGRPRKHTDNHSNNLTETLVSKTPRVPSKNNLVGLIISSKPSHQSSRLKCDKNSVNGDKCSKQTPLTHSHDSSLLHKSSSSSKFSPTFMNSLDEDYKPNKIRPKLKAEAKVKSWVGEEDDILDWTTNLPPDDTKRSNFPDCLTPKTDFLQRHQLAKNKCVLTSTPSSKPCSRKPGVLVKKSKMITEATAKSETRKSLSEMHSNLKPESECQPLMADESLSCSITQEHLLADRPPFRCLINIGGLFYAGQLTAIEPPDLYGLMLDGERGHRNHIHTKEEILNQAVLEVKLSRMPPIGSRVCAYWSQQYRCLYPGTVSSSSSPMQNEMKHASEKFISVEFDDGDSGRILVEDVRLLPQDYPIVVYDPNPLMSLGKRKRRISSMSYDSNPKDKPLEETSHTSVSDARESSSTNIPSPDFHGNGCSNSEDKTSLKHSDDYKEKKRLKKRYRKKHGLSDDSSSSLKRERKRHRSSSNESKDKVRRHHKHKRKRHKHKHQNESSKNDSSRSSYSPVENIVSKSIDDDDNLGDNDDVEDEDREPPKLYGTSSRDGTSTSPEKNLEKLSSSCDIDVKTSKVKEVHAEPKKKKERQHSTENSSKMAPFLPARRLWSWTGKGYKRPGAKGRGRKEYYKSIQRGSEVITVGDCAVFLSTGRPDRPYIGRIEAMWESWGSSMVVKVKWFYHPEETVGCTQELPFPGALFESPHFDENDVQTISHKCEVLPLSQYKQRLDLEPHRLVTVYDQNDIYYLAGFYDPTSMVISFEPDIQKKK